MKLKNVLLVSGLSLAIVLGGCGMSSKVEPIDDVQDTINEDSSQEEIQDEIQEDADEDTQIEGETGESQEAVKAKALLAYQEILKASPAIEGEHEELMDASFGYDENVELFGNHCDCFAIIDVDQDGIPELIASSIVNFRWSTISVYTYEEGEAVLLKAVSEAGTEAHGTFEQQSTANGAYITYICEDHHIHSVWRGTNPIGEEVEENTAYVLEKDETLEKSFLDLTNCMAEESENTIEFYEIAKSNIAEHVNAIIQ